MDNGGDVPADDKPFDDIPFDAGVEADENSDPKKYIQQLAGKLGQTLRNYTETQGGADLELEKFAINSVISATHSADMDPNDKKDIIKKINSSGQDTGVEPPQEAEPEDNVPVDDFGGEAPEGETFGEGIEILPKEHKQVFKDAKLGVTESKDLKVGKKVSIFAENEDMSETVEPLVKPKTVPVVKPDEQPTRRQKPWKISPQESPQPKADIDIDIVTEGVWAKMMGGVIKSKYGGPYTIIVINNGKFVYQKIVEIRDAIPAHYEQIKKDYPNSRIHIEDVGGTVVWSNKNI